MIFQMLEPVLGKMDIYEKFFASIVMLFVGGIITLASIIMTTHDPSMPHLTPTTNAISFVLATLGACSVMMNLGEPKASAKELFWGWIFVTVGLVVIAVVGRTIFLLTGITSAF